METRAILVAAGRGERMGAARPKAFLSLAGQTLLERSARALGAAPSVSALVAVVPADDIEEAREMCEALAKPCEVVPGGERRQDSVRAGLGALPPGFDGVVLVHDAARPLVSVALVEAIVQAVRDHGAAIPVVPLADTIKQVGDGRVAATVDRS